MPMRTLRPRRSREQQQRRAHHDGALSLPAANSRTEIPCLTRLGTQNLKVSIAEVQSGVRARFLRMSCSIISRFLAVAPGEYL
jgi:hypothetical protein